MPFPPPYLNVPILVSKDNAGSDRLQAILAITYRNTSTLHAPQIVAGYCNVTQPGL
jgi:hypothetical protein